MYGVSSSSYVMGIESWVFGEFHSVMYICYVIVATQKYKHFTLYSTRDFFIRR